MHLKVLRQAGKEMEESDLVTSKEVLTKIRIYD
jgi:hypothetical protein